MGYCMNQREARFEIKKENVPAAFDALKRLAGNVKHLSWVSNEVVLAMKTFADAMDEFQWGVDLDDAGNVVNIGFEGDKSGSEDDLFGALAPFVEPGSFIEMDGEDGAMWRWVFRNGEFLEVTPSVIWPK